MQSLSFRRLFLAWSAFAVSAVALASTLQVFELPDHGALTLSVPDGWMAEMQRPNSQQTPSIFLKPERGSGSGLRVTPVWPGAAATKLPDDDANRAQVAAVAQKLAPQSVEGALTVREIKGINVRGFYFAATDRAPIPGEYKYLTQGLVRVGDIALTFTILNNDGEDALAKEALEILRTASFRQFHPG